MAAFNPKQRILGSFSLGRSSGRMAEILKRHYRHHELVFGIANTGKEHPLSLDFGDKCDRHFDMNAFWVEADVNPVYREGTGHKIVTYATASRAGEPFEDVIKKYGIPNRAFPHCTRELKINPIHHYAQTVLGWEKGSYTTAIGYRADELHRVPENWREMDQWYPLIDHEITKPDVLTWWSKMPFDLEIEEHWGNCVTCWKKSDRKLLTLAKDKPDIFSWSDRMEHAYGHAGAGDGIRVFYRRHRSTADILAEAQRPFVPFVPAPLQMSLLAWINASHDIADIDREEDCGSESCEAA